MFRRTQNPTVKPGTRTQDCVPIVDVLEQSLLTREGCLAGAVGFASIADGMLHPDEALTRLSAYGLLLKNLRYRAQLLMSTRPQNIRTYTVKMTARQRVVETQLTRAKRVRDALADYATALRTGRLKPSAAVFERQFGFMPAALEGTPGRIALVAASIANPSWVDDQTAKGTFDANIERARELCQESIDALEHWRQTLLLRERHVEETVDRLERPTRVLLLVTSVPVARWNGKQAAQRHLDEAERKLAQRLAQFATSLQAMNLPSWRLTGDELVFEMLRVYRPGLSSAQSRQQILNVSRLSAPALLGVEQGQVQRMNEDLDRQLS